MGQAALINGTVVGLSPRSVQLANVGIVDDRIDWVGDRVPTDTQYLDCSGCLIMPGNVCAHTHVYSSLARGMPAPRKNPRNFLEVLQYIWWRLDRALDAKSVRASGLLGAVDAIKAGTTTLVDHHASPEFIDGSLDVLADAIGEVGARSLLCYEVTDRGGADRSEAGLRENERFLQENHRALARGMVGAHASFTLEDETLEKLAGLCHARQTGVHIHLAEDESDEVDSLRRSGKRTAQRLVDAGVLSPHSIAAHGVHLQPDELQSLERANTWLVHNCRSNMNNSVGRAPILSFGQRSALGTDGIDGDMFAESRSAYFRAREDSLDVYAEQFTDLLARGADLANQYFSAPLGSLASGASADLVVLDYQAPTPLTADNIAWHWMFALSSQYVRDVMVGGKWVVRERRCVTVDEEKIRADSRQEAQKLWKRMEAL